jgi:hypothetical protein
MEVRSDYLYSMPVLESHLRSKSAILLFTYDTDLTSLTDEYCVHPTPSKM